MGGDDTLHELRIVLEQEQMEFVTSQLAVFGLFLGIVLALGRLYHESEMTAMTACGVGPLRIYRPIALLALVAAALLAVLSYRVVPAAWMKSSDLRVEATRAAQFGALEPGRFRSFADLRQRGQDAAGG
jgi:lipopolysaccharide export LptBFGC system permease protein LptF